MTALAVTFDSFEYCEALEEAGVPEKQAKVHAKAQAAAWQKAFAAYDEKNRAELATKGDLREESIAIRADLRETKLRLEAKIEASKHEMIKWYIGMTLALAGVIIALYAMK